VLRAGDGVNFPRAGSLVRIHYSAHLNLDGRVSAPFDSSAARGTPLVCRVGASQLVAGLDDALPLMSKGERSRLTVPPARAYGPRGFPPIIPPDSVVVYDVEMLAVD
jgi:FK506-binding protein 1